MPTNHNRGPRAIQSYTGPTSWDRGPSSREAGTYWKVLLKGERRLGIDVTFVLG